MEQNTKRLPGTPWIEHLCGDHVGGTTNFDIPMILARLRSKYSHERPGSLQIKQLWHFVEQNPEERLETFPHCNTERKDLVCIFVILIL